jgi:hypothetical protein
MFNETNEFDLPKLSDALQSAYAHRPVVPPSLDQAILTAARQRFDQRRRLRLLARWGAGLAAGLAAAVALMISLHKSAPAPTIARADHPLTMVDALTLAKHLAAKDPLDKSWDLNHDSLIDQQDVQAIATAAVSLKQTLGHNHLPTFQQLGLAHAVSHVGSASADGTTTTQALAQTNLPQSPSQEAPQ